MVLDGCPRFAPPAPACPGAYMGRKRFFQMLSLRARGALASSGSLLLPLQYVGRGYAPPFAAHVRWGEHGAPVQGTGLDCLLKQAPRRCTVPWATFSAPWRFHLKWSCVSVLV